MTNYDKNLIEQQVDAYRLERQLHINRKRQMDIDLANEYRSQILQKAVSKRVDADKERLSDKEKVTEQFNKFVNAERKKAKI